MPRQARKDVATTKLLYSNKKLLDRRSFVGHGTDMVPHLYLHGLDMTIQRELVVKRAAGLCQKCRLVIGYRYGEPAGEVHHIIHRGKGGSDDLDNLRLLCRNCHSAEHVQVHFGPDRKAAQAQFDTLYGESE